MSARHTLAALGATAAGWAVLISACSAPPITSLPLPERQAPPASGAWYRYTDNPYYSRVEALADTQESAGDASAGAKLRTLATTPVAEWFNSASIEDTANVGAAPAAAHRCTHRPSLTEGSQPIGRYPKEASALQANPPHHAQAVNH